MLNVHQLFGEQQKKQGAQRLFHDMMSSAVQTLDVNPDRQNILSDFSYCSHIPQTHTM